MVFSTIKIIFCVLIVSVLRSKTISVNVNQPIKSYTVLSKSMENTTINRIEILILGANIRNNIHCYVNSKNKHTALYLLILLLQNDIETNPGPVKFPCGACGKDVRHGQRAVSCDCCDAWFHINCQGMSAKTYESHIGEEFSWVCLSCGLPNFNSSYFASFSTSNSFEALDLSIPLLTSTPIKDKVPRRKSQLKLLTINCQSIASKKAEFQHTVATHKPDIICATETWLTPDHANGEIGDPDIFMEHYDIFRRDRTQRKGGGVLIATKKDIACERATEVEAECEGVWIRLKQPNGKNLYIASFYRPNASDESSATGLQHSLEQIPQSADIIIAGDLNYPDIDWSLKTTKRGSSNRALHDQFIDLLDDFTLEQVVQDPTRGENILDLILVNRTDLCTSVTVVPGISDHDAVACTLDFRSSRRRLPTRVVPIYNKADWGSLGQHMAECHNTIANRTESMDANQMWTTFKDALQVGIQEFVPTKKAKKPTDKPWLTTRVKRLLNKRDRLYSKQRNSRRRADIEEYQEMRKVAQRECRQAYWSYLDSIITPTTPDETQKCSKRFWSYVKRCGQDSCGIPKLTDEEGNVKTAATDKANILNAQFQSVFTPPSPVSLSAMCESILQPSDAPHMPSITFTARGIDKMLCELNIHKAAGPDGIKPIVLKNLHLVIAPTLQLIFEKSYLSHQTPDDWKSASITPIFKKGKKDDPRNYRPISLTSIASKLMEHVVVSSLMRHLEGNNLLHDSQHGFRSARSCDTQLLDFSHNLVSTMHDGTQTDVIALDFAKAFDTVPHTHLLFKLDRLGVDPTTRQWISSFLHGRKQCVLLDGVCSSEVPVLSGVPQGSVLGPVLFLAYINDLADDISSKVRLFADDTIISREIRCKQDAITLQDDLDKLQAWGSRWQMSFHPGKCQVLRVSRSRSKLTHPYTLLDTQLEATDTLKYLGITFSSDMRWSSHIQNVKAKASSKLGFLRRNVRIASPRLKNQLYSTVVRSTMEYAATVWNPHEAKLVDNLETVQRRAARWVLHRHERTASVTRMLTQLGWCTLAERRRRSQLLMLYKIIHGLAYVPHTFLLRTSNTQHTRNTNPLTFAPFQPRTNYYKFSFFPYAVSQWNALPLSTLNSPSVEAFKARLQQAAAV